MLVLWSVGVAAGCWILLAYGSTSGATGAPPAYWPDGSAIVPAADRPTLVLFAHPHCPCTRASLGELARLSSTCGERLATVIAIYTPSSEPADWPATSLPAMADAIPGAAIVSDIDGREATRFGAATSGHVLLYDAMGELTFSGGITASRGHEGGNAGRTAIERLVGGSPAQRDTTPVFGCPLLASTGSCCPGEDP